MKVRVLCSKLEVKMQLHVGWIQQSTFDMLLQVMFLTTPASTCSPIGQHYCYSHLVFSSISLAFSYHPSEASLHTFICAPDCCEFRKKCYFGPLSVASPLWKNDGQHEIHRHDTQLQFSFSFLSGSNGQLGTWFVNTPPNGHGLVFSFMAVREIELFSRKIELYKQQKTRTVN